MNKRISLLMAAIMAVGIVAFSGVGAKAEAQGITAVGLRLGYNYGETEYRWGGRTYYSRSEAGFHLGLQTDISFVEIDLGSDPLILGFNPTFQLASKGTKRNYLGLYEVKIDAYYLDVLLPIAFKWTPRRASYSAIVEIGPYVSPYLWGDDNAPATLTAALGDGKELMVKFDAGIMAGILFEFNRQFIFGVRATSGILDDDNYTYYYITFGYNFWRN